MALTHSTLAPISRNPSPTKTYRIDQSHDRAGFDDLYSQVENVAWKAGLKRGNFELIPLGSEPGREVQVCIGVDSLAEPETVDEARRELSQRFQSLGDACRSIVTALGGSEISVFFVVKNNAVVMVALEQWQCDEYIAASLRMNPNAIHKPHLVSKSVTL